MPTDLFFFFFFFFLVVVVNDPIKRKVDGYVGGKIWNSIQNSDAADSVTLDTQYDLSELNLFFPV